jgi:hypothetical protein
VPTSSGARTVSLFDGHLLDVLTFRLEGNQKRTRGLNIAIILQAFQLLAFDL